MGMAGSAVISDWNLHWVSNNQKLHDCSRRKNFLCKNFPFRNPGSHPLPRQSASWDKQHPGLGRLDLSFMFSEHEKLSSSSHHLVQLEQVHFKHYLLHIWSFTV